jgi:hypothetical protein
MTSAFVDSSIHQPSYAFSSTVSYNHVRTTHTSDHLLSTPPTEQSQSTPLSTPVIVGITTGSVVAATTSIVIARKIIKHRRDSSAGSIDLSLPKRRTSTVFAMDELTGRNI